MWFGEQGAAERMKQRTKKKTSGETKKLGFVKQIRGNSTGNNDYRKRSNISKSDNHKTNSNNDTNSYTITNTNNNKKSLL